MVFKRSFLLDFINNFFKNFENQNFSKDSRVFSFHLYIQNLQKQKKWHVILFIIFKKDSIKTGFLIYIETIQKEDLDTVFLPRKKVGIYHKIDKNYVKILEEVFLKVNLKSFFFKKCAVFSEVFFFLYEDKTLIFLKSFLKGKKNLYWIYQYFLKNTQHTTFFF